MHLRAFTDDRRGWPRPWGPALGLSAQALATPPHALRRHVVDEIAEQCLDRRETLRHLLRRLQLDAIDAMARQWSIGSPAPDGWARPTSPDRT